MSNKAICSSSLIFFLALAATLPAAAADQQKQQAQSTAQASLAESLLRRPDLAIERIWIVKAGPQPLNRPPMPVTQLKKGVKYLLYCSYKNSGRALNGVWKLGYYVDGGMIWNQYWGNVGAGETQTRFIDKYVPTVVGQHAYECRLDYDNEVAERSEGNNKASITFTVIP
jgi:subtilase family serine protease